MFYEERMIWFDGSFDLILEPANLDESKRGQMGERW